MATNVRGRSGSRPRSTYSRSPMYTPRPGQDYWGKPSTHGHSTRKTKSGSTPIAVPSAWRNCSDSFANKIYSYRTLYNQTKGPAKYGRPSPTTLNSFANWINKGAMVHTVTTAQVAQWAKAARKNFNTRTPTPTTCKNVLWAKFGKNTIKAVARTKTGSFMVATPHVVNGKPFCFPK